MKTLTKKEFIPYLKKISDILDKEEIIHELPFCHIDKMDFNQMFIIIPDHVQSYDISRLFTCSTIKEQEGIIYTIIDDISVNFIKTSGVEWFYTLFYYSWNILNVFVDILLSESFNLRYTRKGLKYKYEDKNIDITNNMKDIFEFLELKFHMVNNGFPTDYTIFEFIQSSPYYDSTYFTMDNFEKHDINFEYNKHYYEKFIEYRLENKPDKKSIDEQIIYIDAYFMKSNFLEKLSSIQMKKEFPDIKFKKIIIEPKVKTIEELKLEKEEEIKLNRKKISLKKMVENKDDEDFDFNIE